MRGRCEEGKGKRKVCRENHTTNPHTYIIPQPNMPLARSLTGMPGRGGSFVPNDISLGGGSTSGTPGSGTDTGRPPFIVLSGPNMGGKSTMLRQCCLAALMAQVRASPWPLPRPSAGDPPTPPPPSLPSRPHSCPCLPVFSPLHRVGGCFNSASRRQCVTIVPPCTGGCLGARHFTPASPRRRHLCAHGGAGPHHGGAVYVLCGAGRDRGNAAQGDSEVCWGSVVLSSEAGRGGDNMPAGPMPATGE